MSYKLLIYSRESTVSVNRIYSQSGCTGEIQNNTEIFRGDKLVIYCTPNKGYRIVSLHVGGLPYTEGDIFIFDDKSLFSLTDLPISIVTDTIASCVNAQDIRAGGTSVITIQKFDNTLYHSLQYEFGTYTGYISEDGTPANEEKRFSKASVDFSPPEEFYTYMGKNQYGECTIRCITYESNISQTSLGENSTSFVIFGEEYPVDICIKGTVKDINETSIAITDDDSCFIRYISKAEAKIKTETTAGVISERKINRQYCDDKGCVKFNDIPNMFSFSAYNENSKKRKSCTLSPTIIQYARPTLNVILSRPTESSNTESSNKIFMSFSGFVYRDYFNAARTKQCSIKIQYRYKVLGGESGDTYGDWCEIEEENIKYVKNSYQSTNNDGTNSISLEGFDYQKEYEFEILVTDGVLVNNEEFLQLSSLTRNIPITRGTPVFDWGENDFNFNVPVLINRVNLMDIVYPIGSVYMSVSDTIPEVISNIGKWANISLGISGVYSWQRVS